MPQLEAYNGAINPVNHLISFKALMLLHGTTNRILYQAFPSNPMESNSILVLKPATELNPLFRAARSVIRGPLHQQPTTMPEVRLLDEYQTKGRRVPQELCEML